MAARRQLSSTPMRKQQHHHDEVPAGYAVDPAAPPMLRFEASLPRLPVPALSSTLAKYVESVQPHLTPQEFERTKAVADAFAKSELGKELQRRLEARRDEVVRDGVGGVEMEGAVRDSWLADWWNDAAYMGYRDPVVVFVSYFYVHLELDYGKGILGRTQAGRAAALLKAMMRFREMVESGDLEPEKVRHAPIAMSSYKWLFNSTRYPTKPSDTAEKFDPKANNHVVFVRKNKLFEVDLVDAEGKELSGKELESQIQKIIELAGSEAATPIGALTSENRDSWTDAREALLAGSPANVEALKRIDSAIVIVCLDDTKPVTRDDVSWACWTGNGRNRWYDKHQFIVFENGRSGFLGEHSCMDGTPTLRLNEFMLASLLKGKIELGDVTSGRSLPIPREIKFEINDKVKSYITNAEQNFDKLVGAHTLVVQHYEGYGKNYIKTHKASPDAWAQLVKQLAFHKLAGRPGVCYESAQTRKFKRGRTEVIRAASNESKAWAEAMLNPNETDEHRVILFRRAVTRHLQYAAWAADGQGVDRHLFGLKKLLKESEQVPELYQDPAYARTNHWELSTSQLSSPFLDGWGYGEVVPDGYGLSYSIGDDYIRWTITSLKEDVHELKHYLAEAATETKHMMERAAAIEKAKL